MPILGVSSGLISKWKKIFQKFGVQGLKLNYKGSKSYLKPREKQEVINWLRAKNS
jgi:putative transposase